MRHPLGAIAVVFGLVLVGLVVSPGVVRAHEQETFVSWDVAYANVDFVGAPTFTHKANLQAAGTAYSGQPGTLTITMATGDYLVITYSFRYIGEKAVRGDLFWVTRLGLDFGTVGRYVDGEWIGGGSFALVPGTQYNATLVIRSIQPVLRHLHVGLSIQDVGNIPAAPTVSPIPEGGPRLYGIFTEASGPVVDPLEGTIQLPGGVGLLAPWPWAVAGLFGQIVIGLAFIAVMYWYGKRLTKREGAT
ncbi:MAG: hypothetical protein HYX97_01375 [Chloroflexi bacterium]|nr:hypothetical protein [Chloroflexota bacterium]